MNLTFAFFPRSMLSFLTGSLKANIFAALPFRLLLTVPVNLLYQTANIPITLGARKQYGRGNDFPGLLAKCSRLPVGTINHKYLIKSSKGISQAFLKGS